MWICKIIANPPKELPLCCDSDGYRLLVFWGLDALALLKLMDFLTSFLASGNEKQYF